MSKKTDDDFVQPKASILIVDDQPTSIYQINEVLAGEYDIFIATSGHQALEFCSKQKPDLILLDVVMPKMNGLELCKRLKNQPETALIPIIFITMLQSHEEENACWDAGGVDFVVKPVNAMTLRNRVKAHLALKFQTELFRSMSFIDDLTGIANRRALEDKLNIYFAIAKRTQQLLSLLIIDIDFFKQYNDRYGHLAGDLCLQKIATLLKKTMVRESDLVARYGGEEFVCLLFNTDSKGATIVAEKLLSNVARLRLKNKVIPEQSFLTISIGIACYPSEKISSSTELFNSADKALYKAKKEGRNRAIIYE